MSAIENLFRAHAGQVHRYAQRHVGLDSADDVVAETFVVVLRRIDHVPHEALPWLLVVARNIIRNHQRHLRRQRVLWSEVVRDQWSGVSEAGADEQVLAREAALSALGQCTPSEREALLLTAWDGLDLPAAALVAGSAYLEILATYWPEHSAILAEAIESGGEISREKMAKHLGRKRNASMQGVGKPFITAARRLIEQGVLDDDSAVIPFSAAYESGGWMSSFEIPANLVSMFKDALVAVPPAEKEEADN